MLKENNFPLRYMFVLQLSATIRLIRYMIEPQHFNTIPTLISLNLELLTLSSLNIHRESH